ncbi:Ig-like domain-containing protein [Niastella sp. OAS944]|uniref:Ig-like domain-containing protein n=1 Tax=Niastella sp. OAS944 TaxID=2664089 RepID=UPI00349B7490|nr:uncharacterized protein YjdB [Chitinophagaceae bacterium OAS944]
MKNDCYCLLTIACLLMCGMVKGQAYTWNQVRIGGSGAIPTFVAHPKVPDLYFVTTDVGTPYRWNKNLQKWEHMMLFEKIPVNYWRWEYNQRCGSIAVDPNDATGNILYAIVENSEGPLPGQGNKNVGTILKSTNRGDTWTDLHVPIASHPNEVKSYDNRLVVDPSNSNVVYAVSDATGAWKSANAGASWTSISTINNPTSNIGFIILDTSAGTITVNGKTVTKRIYLGRPNGVEVSDNGGQSWELMANSPTRPVRATIHGNGTMYVTSNHFMVKKGIFKYANGSWQDISPIYINPNDTIDKRSFAKVAVNPANSENIIVGTFAGWQTDTYWISQEGGAPGKYTKAKISRDNTEAPHSFNDGLSYNAPGHAPFGYTWDPFYPQRIWLTDLLDVVSTDNIFAETQDWKVRVVGLEEIMVTGPMVCPPSGKNVLLTVTADVAGAHHRSLTEPLAEGAVTKTALNVNTWQGLNSQGVAFQYTNPEFVIRVGSNGWGLYDSITDSRSGYSTDGGDHYTRFPKSPGLRGRVAVSANSQRIVWLTQWDPTNPNGVGSVYWSNDLGSSWTRSLNAPTGILPKGSQWTATHGQNHLVADKVNGNYFYIWDRGSFYVSSDGGVSFQKTTATGLSANNGSNPNGTGYATFTNVEVTPGKTGDVWICHHTESSAAASGLFHTTDTGKTFTRVGGTTFAPKWIAVAMSDTTPNAHLVLYTTSAVYPINDIYFGAFRSDDTGRTWNTILDRMPGTAPNITADNRGRMIISCSGNGIFFGAPVRGPVQAVEIVNPKSDTLIVGYSIRLNAKLTPAYPNNPAVTWSTSDTTKAKVDQYGNVTGINSGPVTITVTTVDGGKTDNHNLLIIPPTISTGIAVDSVVYGTVQTPKQIEASLIPANTTNKILNWSVADTAIAKVSSNGIVSGLKLGTTTLTITAADGGSTKTVQLKVTNIITAYNAGTENHPSLPPTPYANVTFGQFLPEGVGGTDKRWHGGYVSTNNVTATVDVSGITEPAPPQVYQYVRISKVNVTPLRYYFRNLIVGATYSIRLHFFEHDNAQKTNRVFSVKATNGDSLIEFNPYAAAGNKLNTVVTRTLSVKADNNGVATVTFYPKMATNDPHSATVAAVELRVIPLQGIAIQSNSDTISVNHTDTLQLVTNPVNASNRSVVYKTSNESVATVNLNGVVTGKAAGTVTITATSVEGNYASTKNYTVVYTPVTSVTLNTTNANIFVGDTIPLTATVLPAKASNKTIVWTSADTTIAKVSATGFVNGVKEGDVVIKATSADNATKFAQASVHVANVLATSVTLTPSPAIVGERDTVTLKATFTPANTSIKTLTWSSSDTTVAKINNTGKITAIKQGTTTITAITQDTSGVSTTLPVTIVPFDSCGGIKNNGFESGMVNWVSYWKNTPTPGAVYTMNGKGHTGDKAVTMGFTEDKTGLNIEGSVPVPGGGVIVFTKWVKVEQGATGYPWWAGYGVKFVDALGAPTGNADYQKNLTGVPAYMGQWAQIRDTVTLPDSARGLTFWAAKEGPGTVWFDDFCIEVITTNRSVIYAVNAGTQQNNTGLPQTPYYNTTFAQYLPEGPGQTYARWHGGYTWIQNITSPVDVTGVEDPAPPQVYEYMRISKVNMTPMRYYVRDLTPNTYYNIRLHFVEPDNVQKNNRIFSVKATNGIDSLTDFNPYAAAGNKLNTAVIRTLTARADANGLIVVWFYPKTGMYDPYSASLAALEVRTLAQQPSMARIGQTANNNTISRVLSLAADVFPNPAEGGFNIKITSPSAEKVLLTVVDNYGRLIYSKQVNANQTYLLGEKLKAGIYHVKVKQGAQNKTIKIVKK